MKGLIITASIVTYNNSSDQIKSIVDSIIDHIDRLYISDNSLTRSLEELCSNEKIEYIYNGVNLGFGRAHNIAIDKAISFGSDYHFIVNPDIYFFMDVVSPMVEYMRSNENIGMMMPKILYPSGDTQYLPKLLPSPSDLIMRKLKKPKKLYENFIDKYELRQYSDTIYNAPILSGCFTLLNLNAIKEIGVYDERFFMYFEDFDLSRRMHQKYKTLYFPLVSIYHEYESGANKKFILFKIFISSTVKYFNKWGWFFDRERRIVNRKTLNQFSL